MSSTPIPTRTRLLEAAIACIEARGYAATTARDVATAAEANLASIGYHFGSMDALLDEALIVATERWIAPLIDAAATSSALPLRDRLIDGLTHFVASLPEHRHTVSAFFEAMARVERSDRLRARLAAAYDDLRAGVGAVDGGAAGHPDTPATDGASAVVALYDGVLVQWLLDPNRPINAPSMVAAVARVVSPAETREAESGENR